MRHFFSSLFRFRHMHLCVAGALLCILFCACRSTGSVNLEKFPRSIYFACECENVTQNLQSQRFTFIKPPSCLQSLYCAFFNALTPKENVKDYFACFPKTQPFRYYYYALPKRHEYTVGTKTKVLTDAAALVLPFESETHAAEALALFRSYNEPVHPKSKMVTYSNEYARGIDYVPGDETLTDYPERCCSFIKNAPSNQEAGGYLHASVCGRYLIFTCHPVSTFLYAMRAGRPVISLPDREKDVGVFYYNTARMLANNSLSFNGAVNWETFGTYTDFGESMDITSAEGFGELEQLFAAKTPFVIDPQSDMLNVSLRIDPEAFYTFAQNTTFEPLRREVTAYEENFAMRSDSIGDAKALFVQALRGDVYISLQHKFILVGIKNKAAFEQLIRTPKRLKFNVSYYDDFACLSENGECEQLLPRLRAQKPRADMSNTYLDSHVMGFNYKVLFIKKRFASPIIRIQSDLKGDSK